MNEDKNEKKDKHIKGTSARSVLKALLSVTLAALLGGSCWYAYRSYLETSRPSDGPRVFAAKPVRPTPPAVSKDLRPAQRGEKDGPSVDSESRPEPESVYELSPDIMSEDAMYGHIPSDVSADAAPEALYPEMYSHAENRGALTERKTAYLTFDDGPSNATPIILDTLGKYGVKATFFVTGRANGIHGRALLARMAAEGHTVAAHSYSHLYRRIYASPAAFLKDFKRIYDVIYDATGAYPTIFRFPGGSVNHFNMGTRHATATEMLRRGFIYYDWNVYGGDAEKHLASPASIASKCLREFPRSRRAIILLHDGNPMNGTVGALPAIINGYRRAGYRFEPLTPQVHPILLRQPAARAAHADTASKDISAKKDIPKNF